MSYLVPDELEQKVREYAVTHGMSEEEALRTIILEGLRALRESLPGVPQKPLDEEEAAVWDAVARQVRANREVPMRPTEFDDESRAS